MSSNEILSSASAGTESKQSSSASQFPKPPQASLVQMCELARQVVEVAQAFPGVSGARLWQTADGELTAWQQSGEIPLANKSIGEKVSAGHATAGAEERSRWLCPLSRNDEILGILEVCGSGTLSVDLLSSIEKFARIAAMALGQVAEQQAVQDLSSILEATKLLNSTLDLRELVNIILQLSSRLCGADRGTVFLLDRERNEIWSLKGLGLEEREIRLPIERGIAGWVARHGDPVRIEDASADPRFDPAVDRALGYHTRELLALSIRNKNGEIIGVLELLNKKTGSFTAGDENSLNHLSVHVAVALENAQLHRELLATQRIESDLALARSVQHGLLPEKPPELEGFEIAVAYVPSLMVGGDYYDFMRLKPESLLAVIADVEGKGVASALMMANLHASLHTLATHVHALEHIVESINEMIFSDTRVQKLLSMFVAVIDERNRVLHYINAGHVPPVVISSGGEVVRLDEGGIVLGAVANAAYQRGRLQLRPGDVFAAYTDGITEAMDVQGEQYGFQRLVNLVRSARTSPAKQIVETVLSEVDRFSTDSPDEDDRVMLILKVR